MVEYNKHNPDKEHSYDRKWESTDAVSSCFVLKLFTHLCSTLPAIRCATLIRPVIILTCGTFM